MNISNKIIIFAPLVVIPLLLWRLIDGFFSGFIPFFPFFFDQFSLVLVTIVHISVSVILIILYFLYGAISRKFASNSTFVAIRNFVAIFVNVFTANAVANSVTALYEIILFANNKDYTFLLHASFVVKIVVLLLYVGMSYFLLNASKRKEDRSSLLLLLGISSILSPIVDLFMRFWLLLVSL